MYLILKKLPDGLARNPPLAPHFVCLEFSRAQEAVERWGRYSKVFSNPTNVVETLGLMSRHRSLSCLDVDACVQAGGSPDCLPVVSSQRWRAAARPRARARHFNAFAGRNGPASLMAASAGVCLCLLDLTIDRRHRMGVHPYEKSTAVRMSESAAPGNRLTEIRYSISRSIRQRQTDRAQWPLLVPDLLHAAGAWSPHNCLALFGLNPGS